VQAALNRDYTLVMGVTIFYAALIHRHEISSPIYSTACSIRA